MVKPASTIALQYQEAFDEFKQLAVEATATVDSVCTAVCKVSWLGPIVNFSVYKQLLFLTIFFIPLCVLGVSIGWYFLGSYAQYDANFKWLQIAVSAAALVYFGCFLLTQLAMFWVGLVYLRNLGIESNRALCLRLLCDGVV